jgi:hypothetical protein
LANVQLMTYTNAENDKRKIAKNGTSVSLKTAELGLLTLINLT